MIAKNCKIELRKEDWQIWYLEVTEWRVCYLFYNRYILSYSWIAKKPLIFKNLNESRNDHKYHEEDKSENKMELKAILNLTVQLKDC